MNYNFLLTQSEVSVVCTHSKSAETNLGRAEKTKQFDLDSVDSCTDSSQRQAPGLNMNLMHLKVFKMPSLFS